MLSSGVGEAARECALVLPGIVGRLCKLQHLYLEMRRPHALSPAPPVVPGMSTCSAALLYPKRRCTGSPLAPALPPPRVASSQLALHSCWISGHCPSLGIEGIELMVAVAPSAS